MMRVISTSELSRLTRTQLFALYTQMQAVLADMPQPEQSRRRARGRHQKSDSCSFSDAGRLRFLSSSMTALTISRA